MWLQRCLEKTQCSLFLYLPCKWCHFTLIQALFLLKQLLCFLLVLWIRLAVMNLTTVIKSPLQRTDCQGYDGQMFHILQSNHLCLVWRIPKESCQLRNEVEVAWSFWSMLIQLWWSTHILQLFSKSIFILAQGRVFFVGSAGKHL